MNWFYKLLGVKDRTDEVLLAIAKLDQNIDRLHNDMAIMRSDFTVTMYDEHDPRRKTTSDVIGNRMQRKMIGDENARRQIEGKPLLPMPKELK
jgi:hypothetical protein